MDADPFIKLTRVKDMRQQDVWDNRRIRHHTPEGAEPEEFECGCYHCVGEIHEDDWALHGGGTYHVRDTIKSDYKCTWDPLYKVWLLKRTGAKEALEIQERLQRALDVLVAEYKQGRQEADARRPASAKKTKAPRREPKTKKPRLGPDVRPKGYCACLTCGLGHRCMDPDHYTTLD